MKARFLKKMMLITLISCMVVGMGAIFSFAEKADDKAQPNGTVKVVSVNEPIKGTYREGKVKDPNFSYGYDVVLKVYFNKEGKIIEVRDDGTEDSMNKGSLGYPDYNRPYLTNFLSNNGLGRFAGKSKGEIESVDAVSGATALTDATKRALNTAFVEFEKTQVNPNTGVEVDENNDDNVVQPGTEPNQEQPKIVAGENQKWLKESKDGLNFTSDADFNIFMKVMVDGNELAKDIDYAVKSGSTKVTLFPTYLEKLDLGHHSLEIVSQTGTAATRFEIAKNASTEKPVVADIAKNSGRKTQNAVNTGDSNDILMYVMLGVIALGAILVSVRARNK